MSETLNLNDIKMT